MATDAFGNALGQSLVDYMAPPASAASSELKPRKLSKSDSERQQYMGMTKQEVLGGEKDWEGLMGPYRGNIDLGEDVGGNTAANPEVLPFLQKTF